MTKTEARAIYTVENNRGNGYEAAAETVDAAVESMLADGGKLVLRADTSDDVAVVEMPSGKLVAIGGDGVGGSAWAVTIQA